MTSRSSISTNPADWRSDRWSRRDATALGPAKTARRWSRFDKPGVTCTVKKAVRPPGRSNRLHALSTESFAVSQHRTSAVANRWKSHTSAAMVTADRLSIPRKHRSLAMAASIGGRSHAR